MLSSKFSCSACRFKGTQVKKPYNKISENEMFETHFPRVAMFSAKLFYILFVHEIFTCAIFTIPD